MIENQIENRLSFQEILMLKSDVIARKHEEEVIARNCKGTYLGTEMEKSIKEREALIHKLNAMLRDIEM